VSRYQKGKTKLDFTEARDSEWQWRQMSHMQICTSPRQITTPTSHQFLQARRPSCHLTNSGKALKANNKKYDAKSPSVARQHLRRQR